MFQCTPVLIEVIQLLMVARLFHGLNTLSVDFVTHLADTKTS